MRQNPAGWLEGMMHTLLAGVDLSANGQALDAIADVGSGKHFLGCAHTQANFEAAFCRSPLADINSYEQWEAEGAYDRPRRPIQWSERLGAIGVAINQSRNSAAGEAASRPGACIRKILSVAVRRTSNRGLSAPFVRKSSA
jgi:hypothetical protein